MTNERSSFSFSSETMTFPSPQSERKVNEVSEAYEPMFDYHGNSMPDPSAHVPTNATISPTRPNSESVLTAAFRLALTEILSDIDGGVVPSPSCFSDLHDSVDANEYIGYAINEAFGENLPSETWFRLSNRLLDMLDGALRFRSGMLSA